MASQKEREKEYASKVELFLKGMVTEVLLSQPAGIKSHLMNFLAKTDKGVKPKAMVEPMVAKTKSGPHFHLVWIPSAYGDQFQIVSAEPVEGGGSGEGQNTMMFGIMSIPVCSHEQSMILTEGFGFES